MTSVTVRLDEMTKEQAARIVEDLGLDLPSVTRAFYRQIIRERRVPLDLSCEPSYDSSRVLPPDPKWGSTVLPAAMDDEPDGLYDHLVEA